MDKRSLPLIAAAAALLVVLAALGYYYSTHIRVGTTFYPKGQETLEITEPLSAADYQTLRSQMPDTEIICNINFHREIIPYTIEELTVTRLSRNDIPFLQSLPNLKVVHAENCPDYAPLEYLTNRMPEIKVYYGIEIDGVYYDQDVESIAMPDPDLAILDNLSHMPKLKKLDVTGSTDYAKLAIIASRFPQWQIFYTITFNEQEISNDVQMLELEGAQYRELRTTIPFLPHLEKLVLINPFLTSAELESLIEEFPDIDISTKVIIAGITIDDSVEELDLSDHVFEELDEVEYALKSASFLPNMKKLIIDAGTIPNLELSNLRSSYLNSCELVWTVQITSKISLRTDVKSFSPKEYGDYSFVDNTSDNLIYCIGMESLNLSGTALRSISFCKGMPNLRYLDISKSQITDITGLSNCKQLVMLNISANGIRSVSTLAKCTALEDLNMSNTRFKIDTLGQMTWLNNIYAVNRNVIEMQALQNHLSRTNIVTANGIDWQELPNYITYTADFTK